VAERALEEVSYDVFVYISGKIVLGVVMHKNVLVVNTTH